MPAIRGYSRGDFSDQRLGLNKTGGESV